MYTSIRRYEGISPEAVETIIKRAKEGFVPIVNATEGCVGYYVIDTGDGVIATISIFESQTAAEKTNTAASNWIKENLASLIPNPPQITAGETRLGITANNAQHEQKSISRKLLQSRLYQKLRQNGA